MRANLVQREPARLAHWEKLGLYDALQNQRANAPVFVLHGWPSVHQWRRAHRDRAQQDAERHYSSLQVAPRLPHAVCSRLGLHGLPIEQKVARELQGEKAIGPPPPETASSCAANSPKPGLPDREPQFQRPRRARGPGRMSTRPRLPRSRRISCARLPHSSNKGSSIAAKKPVYWSIPFETALAEARSNTRTTSAHRFGSSFPLPPAEAETFSSCGATDLLCHLDHNPLDLARELGIACIRTWSMFSPRTARNPAGRYMSQNPCCRLLVRQIGDDGPTAWILPIWLPAGSRTVRATIRRRFWRSFPARLWRTPKPHPFIDRAAPVVLADYVTTDKRHGLRPHRARTRL